MQAAFEICGQAVPPGARERIDVPLGRLVTQQMLDLPVIVVHGHLAGPTVWLSAAIHGDEIHGTEVIRRVLERLSAKRLRGTVVAMPVVNVWGFVNGSRYFPDRRDLNRSFPGSLRGSLAGQIAHLLLTEIISRCDYGIDLHSGSHHRVNAPQARGDLEDPRVAALCKAFAAPFTIHGKLRVGSLRHAAAQMGVPCLLYEAGEPHRFDEAAVTSGRVGILRVLEHLEMIDQAPRGRPTRIARDSHWARARRSGIVHLQVGLGEEVRAGDTIGVIRDPYGTISAGVRARKYGAVIGHRLNPLVNRGDALVHIAHVEPLPPEDPA